MLTFLLVTGILAGELSPGTGELTAPPERVVVIPLIQSKATVSVGSPLGAQRYAQPFDPSDNSEFASDFTPLLRDDETIVDIEMIALGAAGAALGVTIDVSDDHLPRITDDGKHVQYWLSVDPAQWAALAFDANGTTVQVKERIATSQGRRYERSMLHEVRQL